MILTRTVCLVAALLCFVLAAFGVPLRGLNLTAAGLAFLTAAMLVPG